MATKPSTPGRPEIRASLFGVLVLTDAGVYFPTDDRGCCDELSSIAAPGGPSAFPDFRLSQWCNAMSRNETVPDGALEAIRNGKLPDRSPDRTLAGPGCGAPCVICGRPANADELEYELEFFTGDEGRQPQYHVHIGCF